MTTTEPKRDGFVHEVADLDCAHAGPEDVARVRDLLFAHGVLVLRDQHPSPAQFLRFMTALGTPIRHVLQELTVEGFPDILKISDFVHPDGRPDGVLDGGSYWHADMSYLPVLGVATALYAVRAAPTSGATSFLDLAAGWRLVREDRDLLDALGCATPDDAHEVVVEHRFGNRQALRDPAAARQRLSADQHAQLPPTRHRLVERHPVTGRPALFAPAGSAMALAGRDEPGSTAALDRLEAALFAGLVPYTHHYRPGDLVIWDNTSTLHRGVLVRPTRDRADSRLLHRINIDYTGDAP
jgi:taurine dioxygenase